MTIKFDFSDPAFDLPRIREAARKLGRRFLRRYPDKLWTAPATHEIVQRWCKRGTVNTVRERLAK